jgi:hypothetical protein
VIAHDDRADTDLICKVATKLFYSLLERCFCLASQYEATVSGFGLDIASLKQELLRVSCEGELKRLVDMSTEAL